MEYLLFEFVGHAFLRGMICLGLRHTRPYFIERKMTLHAGGTCGKDTKVTEKMCREDVQRIIMGDFRPQFANQNAVPKPCDVF